MSKVKEYIRPVSAGASRFSGESLDCTVRALANVKEIPYHEAHEILKNYGRVNGKGSNVHVFHKAYTENGLRLICAFGTTNDAIYMHRVVGCPKIKGMTISSFMKQPSIQNGKFIVGTKGHVFAVIDGDLIDDGSLKGAASVSFIYKLEE